jgi:ketosteroid isomerase-like protein
MQAFIDIGGKLEARVKRVLQANELVLLITEWSISGTEPDGKPINFTGRAQWFYVDRLKVGCSLS